MNSSAVFHDQLQYLDFHTHRLQNAERKDVAEIVSLHLGEEKPHQYFTVGLHPWQIKGPITTDQSDRLKEVLQAEKCLAMGEMGLDKLKGADMNTQTRALRTQLEIAEELRKPVIIHCVRAYEQLIKIKKTFPNLQKWCIHGYGRHATLAKQLIDQGFYLSIMPTVTEEKYKAFFQELPHNRLFLETDSMPKVSIEQVYRTVSASTSMALPHLCRKMKQNAVTFFTS